jgi:orotate phosphoribosyltransferase
MHLLPTPDEVVRVLRESGALRHGHFRYPNGLHSDEYLQVPLAFRYYQHARMMSVGLSRMIRSNPELRAIIPELSIVSAGPAGLPVAYGICEALRSRQVYWAEKDSDEVPMRFRQFLEQHPGEQVVMVDDILRSGSRLTEMKTLLERNGATVAAVAVVIYQPTPLTKSFGNLPVYHLAKLSAGYFAKEAACNLCRSGEPLETVWL